jgi:mRNA interferase RelE/StbE
MTFINYLKGYSLQFTASAQKELERFDITTRKAIDKKLTSLISGSQGLDVKKLTAYKNPTYRLRVGMYRVIYEVYETKVIVLVVGVAHRKGAYK